jgi:hypothetical protein
VEEESILQNLAFPPFGLNSLGAGDFVGGRPSFANPFQDVRTGVVNPNKFPATFFSPGDPVDFSIYEPFIQSVISPNFETPYAMNYNLTIQRELPANIVATVSYVGSVGRRLQTTVELNPITPAGQAACLADINCSDPANQVGADFHGLDFPSHTLLGNGDIFSSMHSVATTGKSNYNSLQISATKGRTHGLFFQASYTYSHSLDDGSGFENAGFANALGGGSRGYNQYFPNLSYGNSANDIRHRFVFSPVYDIPNWKGIRGMSWLPDAVGKGWKISGILTLASGLPFDISYAGGESYSLFCAAGLSYYACPDSPSQLNTAAGLQVADPRTANTGSCASGGGTATTFCWFRNLNGNLVDEPVGTFGNISRYKYHGPGLNNVDVLVGKEIHFWPGNENRYLELRIEFYNVLNHTQFALPNGNLDSANFGRITAAAPGRLIQLGAKIYF